MKNIALLMSVILVSNCFAVRHKSIQVQRLKLLKLEKTICKKLVRNPETGMLSFVNSAIASGNRPLPIISRGRSVINWPQLIADHGKIIDSLDQEIELTKK